MTDDFVGTWTFHSSSAIGFGEYINAIGKSDKFSAYITDFVNVFTKTGDKEYKVISDIQGMAGQVEQDIKIGEKTKHLFPAIGFLEADTTLDGNKLVRTSNYGVIPLKEVKYVEGNTMVIEITAGNATTVLPCQKS